MNKKKTLLVVTALILILGISVIFFVINLNSNSSVTVQDPDEDIPIFTGNLVRAELPKGWEIKEYNSDTKEEQILSDGEYSGLVSLEILNDNKIVFSLDGVSGVGYQEICYGILKFPDTDNSYIETKQRSYSDYARSMNEESSENLPEQAEIEELGSAYTQINVFDRQARRIGKNLYWNTKDTISFNPECGAKSSFIEFTEPKFYSTYNGGQQYTMSLYTARINDDVSEEQLLQLDQILDSLEII
jgi:hypothetical protein